MLITNLEVAPSSCIPYQGSSTTAAQSEMRWLAYHGTKGDPMQRPNNLHAPWPSPELLKLFSHLLQRDRRAGTS